MRLAPQMNFADRLAELEEVVATAQIHAALEVRN
jgi:hypothetical protein